MPAALEHLFTTEELAEYLHLPVRTLYQWAYKGTGPQRISVGRHTRYRASDVEAWLEQQSRG